MPVSSPHQPLPAGLVSVAGPCRWTALKPPIRGSTAPVLGSLGKEAAEQRQHGLSVSEFPWTRARHLILSMHSVTFCSLMFITLYYLNAEDNIGGAWKSTEKHYTKGSLKPLLKASPKNCKGKMWHVKNIHIYIYFLNGDHMICSPFPLVESEFLPAHFKTAVGVAPRPPGSRVFQILWKQAHKSYYTYSSLFQRSPWWQDGGQK